MKKKGKYYENLDLIYHGIKWHRGLIPAFIMGILTYVIAHFYGEVGTLSGLEVGEETAKELNDTLDWHYGSKEKKNSQ